jgi:hypothetical protein
MDNELQEQYFGHQHVTLIEPIKGWRMQTGLRLLFLRSCNG